MRAKYEGSVSGSDTLLLLFLLLLLLLLLSEGGTAACDRWFDRVDIPGQGDIGVDR